jgi:transcriptional regulator with XRE-family HTH domain
MINRIQLILKAKNLSPSQFADQISVQRSGVSHILSGRNNPSLDFILKVLKTYPEIDADWLLFGKGQMINIPQTKEEVLAKPKEEVITKVSVQPDLFAQVIDEPSISIAKASKAEKSEPIVSSASISEKVKEDIRPEIPDKTNKIEKIVVFYENCTFKEYKPK